MFVMQQSQIVLKSLYEEGDRASALIAGSIVDTRLEACLRSIMKQSDKIQNRLFGSYGPLGSFSARIDLSYLLHILSEDAHHDLNIIRNIRNDFAHNLSIKGFKDKRVKDRALNLKLFDKFVGGYQKNEKVKNICTIGHNNDQDSQIRLKILDFDKNRDDPRTRYLSTCSLIDLSSSSYELHPVGCII